MAIKRRLETQNVHRFIFYDRIAVILYGLVNSTEKVLAIRHQQREDGKRPNVYL